VQGCNPTHKSFDLVKIRAESHEIQAKSSNPGKISENLLKFVENQSKNGAQRALI